MRTKIIIAATIVTIIPSSALLTAAEGITLISQRERHFDPAEVTIARGAHLKIVNDDDVTHHVYVDTPEIQFDSGEQPVGTSVDLVFSKLGKFPVRCAIHPTMRLTVSVN